jgi:hypothetical protein
MSGQVSSFWQPGELGYCSNVHAGESLTEVLANFSRFIAPVRQQQQLEQLDSGLWLSAAAAAELQQPAALQLFQQQLRQHGIRLTSLNGFPFGNFHQAEVKTNAYLPDWSEPERLHYSKQLAMILASCLPDDCERGVISTVPLGYQAHWTAEKQQQAQQQLLQLTHYLAELKATTGKQILFCLEMEPDCVLQTTAQSLEFFRHWQQLDPNQQFLGLCFDVCHQAVLHENCYQSLTQLRSSGIPIGKIQLSSALVLKLDKLNWARRSEVLALLADFAESTYLHQAKALSAEGLLQHWADLPEALWRPDQWLEQYKELRVHFHVPLFHQQLLLPELCGTQAALQQCFDFLRDHKDCHPVLEVETYSWNVLPQALRPDGDAALIAGIAQELSWVWKQLQQRQLLQLPEGLSHVS